MRTHDPERQIEPGSQRIQRGPGRPATQRRPGGEPALLSLQRSAGNAEVTAMLAEEEPSGVQEVVERGGGSPLDAGTRDLMESRLGHDFGDVRVHTDAT